MSSPNSGSVEMSLESGTATAANNDGRAQISMLDAVTSAATTGASGGGGVASGDKEEISVLAAYGSGDTKDTTLYSALTFGSAGGATAETERTEGGSPRRVNTNDVKQIFRGSTTTGTVSYEQLERVKMMHDKISNGVKMNFNYSCLLMVASVVAGLGLATDSATTVISSMLLSPIMGPVIGMSYGLVVWDLPLIYRSARNEIVSIIICVIFGLIIGALSQHTQMADEWPTQEMLSRGTRTTFLAGIPIAFFSGLGVALSVLDDQTSSLVGVAISASLLPPAVNCGMMFIVAAIRDVERSHNLQSMEEPNIYGVGIISLCLTCVNVLMVAIGSSLMFRVKEVLPVEKKIFWDDLKIARRIYQGRAVDSISGEPLTIEQLKRVYEQKHGPPVLRVVPNVSDDAEDKPTQLAE